MPSEGWATPTLRRARRHARGGRDFVVLAQRVLTRFLGVGHDLARGESVISTETDSNDSKITVRIPQEWQSMAANGGVE